MQCGDEISGIYDLPIEHQMIGPECNQTRWAFINHGGACVGRGGTHRYGAVAAHLCGEHEKNQQQEHHINHRRKASLASADAGLVKV